MSLRQIREKIKSFGAGKRIYPIYTTLAITISILNAYGLGLINNLPNKSEIKIIEGLELDFDVLEEGIVGEGAFTASKNGTKYYPIGCSSVNRIKIENRVYFSSVESAEKAGYEPAKTC